MDAKKQAKLLEKFALDKDGFFDSANCAEVLAYIADSDMSDTKKTAILKELLRLAKKNEFEKTCTVEHCGKISEQTTKSLMDFAEKKLGRKLHFIKRENTGLIAGVRLRAADMLWESSAQNALKNLK